MKPLSNTGHQDLLFALLFLGHWPRRWLTGSGSTSGYQSRHANSSTNSFTLFWHFCSPRRPPTESRRVNTHPDYTHNGLVCCFKNHPQSYFYSLRMTNQRTKWVISCSIKRKETLLKNQLELPQTVNFLQQSQISSSKNWPAWLYSFFRDTGFYSPRFASQVKFLQFL